MFAKAKVSMEQIWTRMLACSGHGTNKEDENEKTDERTKNSFISTISCNWTNTSIYYDADSGNRKNALSNAYTCIIMRVYCWMAVWIDRWVYYPVTAKRVVRYANDDAKCILYGI